MVNMLKERGYKTTVEHVRHYIDTQKVAGKTIEEIKANQLAFQRGVIKMQIAEEEALSPDEVVFLDRAIPDALAYYRFLDLADDKELKEAFRRFRYKKVFILDILPLVNDYARTEDGPAQKKIHRLLVAVYEALDFLVVHIPVLPPKERLEFILKNL